MIVVAAVDQSERGARVVRETVELADAFDAEPHVVHVLSQSKFVSMERTETHKTGRPANMDRVRKHARDIAEEAAADAGVDAPVETVGLVGDPAPTILEYAVDNDARFVVVGARKRSATGKLIFGSVTQSILLDADRSVVAVAPPGSESD